MKLIVALILVPVTFFGQIPQRLSLEDAIKLGQERSKMLSISRTKVETASARSSESNANLLPSITVAGGYSRLSDVTPFEIPAGLLGNPQPLVISPVVLDNYSSRITVQQPIFTGFKLR